MGPSKQDKKLPPISASPEKQEKELKPASSPSKRKSKSDILKNKGKAVGWYLRSVLLEGNLELTTITTQTGQDDGYFQPLVKKLEEGDGNDGVEKIGLIGAFYMRISLKNPGKLENSKKKFQRRAFIRVLDEGEDTVECRLAGLKVIKEFLERSANNSYGTPVFIVEPTWNMNGELKDIPKVDHYLEYNEIVKIMKKLYDDVNPDSATENPTDAEFFFTDGYIPFRAHKDLGYPLSKVMAELPTYEI